MVKRERSKMDATPTPARARAVPDDYEHVMRTRERVEARGDMPTVRRLAKRIPKRYTAHQRDVLARTMRRYDGRLPS